MTYDLPQTPFAHLSSWVPYETRFPVRFGLCDPARIIYFPNYFDFFHAAMEDFFRDRVGALYHVLLGKERIGFPTVHLEVDFATPVAFGDEVKITVEIAKLGRSSVAFRYTGYRSSDGKQVVVATQTTVCTDLDAFKSVTTPDFLRAPLEREEKAAAAKKAKG
ncbi:MAG TPA: thioesterase family protein [Planctomycetota bacterium]|nr:thioesterase family protein [Planctomycetota bacterium]